jgi:hypothetical protein
MTAAADRADGVAVKLKLILKQIVGRSSATEISGLGEFRKMTSALFAFGYDASESPC